MKKSILIASMLATMAPFGLQALTLTINGQTYQHVEVTSVTTTAAGVAIQAYDPSNEIIVVGAPPGDPKTPNPFAFTAQPGVPLSEEIVSNTVTISGIETPPSAITITDGEYRIGNNAWTSQDGTITNDDTVTIRHTSAASNSTQTNTTLTIGERSALFRSTTEAADSACGPLPANVTETADLNWASPGSLVVIPMRNETVSTRFVATNNPAYQGKISVGNTAGNANVTREVWVSACPGTPYAEAPAACKQSALMPNFPWAQSNVRGACVLTPNTEYYINIRNTNCDTHKGSGTRCDSTRIIFHNQNP